MPVTFSAPVVRDLSTFKINANQPKAPGGIGGFLERNAGTIGSIALPAIADIATGGLALPADVALSAAGGAAGQAVSNIAQHKNVGSGVAGAAGSGAIGAIGGRVLSGAGSLLSKIVSKPIESGVAKAAEKKVLDQAIADEAPFKGIAKPIREKLNLQDTITHAKNLKLAPTPENFRLASGLATGAEGQGTIGLETALQGKKVNVGDYLGHVQQAINEEPVLQDATGTKLLRQVTNNKENNLFKGNGSLTQNADANDVMHSIRYHEGQAARYASSAAGTEGEAIGKVHQAAANYLKGALDSNPEINKAIEGYKFSPEDTAKFIEDVQKAGGSPELAQHIVDNINNAKGVADLRSFQAPFVRMGKIANEADKAAGGQLTKAVANGAGSPYRNMSTMYEAGAALHGNPVAAGMVVTKAAKNPAVVEKAGNLLSKLRTANNALPGKATVGQEAARIAGQVNAHRGEDQPASDTSSSSLTDAINSVQPTVTAPAGDTSSPFSGGNIQKAIAADIAMTGGKHLNELLSLYNAFGKSQDALTTNQKNEVTGAQKAQQALSDYAAQLDSVGGGQGPITGGINSTIIGQYTNPAAHALESQRTDVATSVASALTPTGRPTASVIKQIADSLPTIHDTQEVAKAKLVQLMQRIQNGEFSAEQPIGQ